MMSALARLVSPLILLLIVVAGGKPASSTPSEDDNLALIDHVLSLLNDNLLCKLPSFEIVDKMHTSFTELSDAWGPDFESRLSPDQVRVRETLLHRWDSVRKDMNSAVMIRSAKKRMFLCKVESYQKAKFGSSVCATYKDVRGPITDHFIKEPITRYLKHLETGDVVERPVEPASTTAVSPKLELEESSPAMSEAESVGPEPNLSDVTSEEVPEGAEAAVEAERVDVEEAKIGSTQEENVEEPTQEEETRELALEEISGKHESAEQGEANEAVDSGSKPSEAAKEEQSSDLGPVTPSRDPSWQVDWPRDEPELEGVEYNFISKFTVELNTVPKKIVVEIDLDDNKRDHEDEINRDPLDDIPVPSSSDDDEQPEDDTMSYSGSEGESSNSDSESDGNRSEEVSEEEEEGEDGKERESGGLVLPPGVELVDADVDDDDLRRLVRVPKKDWQFDPVFGYFRWPDECNEDMCPIEQKLDDSLLSQDGAWYQFISDPVAYDRYLESLKPPTPPPTITAPTPRRKINPAYLRRQKNQLMEAAVDYERRERLFGWTADKVPPKIEPVVMPEIKRDRWKQLTDNTFCKISYNRDYIKKKSKAGYKAVKSFVASAESRLERGSRNDPFAFRQHLLTKPSFL